MASAASGIWAVGAFNMTSEGASTLTEHYTGGCVTPTATATSVPPTPRATATLSSATATASPSTTRPARTSTPLPSTGTPAPSSTATPPTSTATTTPAYCQTTFTDVPPGSPFYSYIRCLACSGIINGYRDNTFRPNNNVTRGQLAKIAANAAGFTDPQTTQLFQDVPPGSPFFTYIGRLAARGFISGYACGGPGEPCTPPGSLPYFRPNTGATRGQIAKIVANAAGFNETPGGRQFADVPPGSPYYTYIYRLASRAIISGYACGGPGEPCMPPDNLPYFRSNHPATRGQTSKIVANTFSPTCPPPAR